MGEQRFSINNFWNLGDANFELLILEIVNPDSSYSRIGSISFSKGTSNKVS